MNQEPERRPHPSGPEAAREQQPAAPVVPGPMSWREGEVEAPTVLSVASVLLKHWKLVTGLPVLAAALAGLVSLIIPAEYRATTTFVPEAGSEGLRLPSGLAALASQFGISGPGGVTTSPQLYADVLRSRTIREQVLKGRFADPGNRAPGDSATLLDILQTEGETEAERLENGREELEDRVSLAVNRRTNVVTVSVETRFPTLSADVANYFVYLINRFNFETRQSSAGALRRFMEERVSEAEVELLEAEEELKRFLEGNRQFEGSPELRFQYERLQRQVRIKEEVLATLRRQHEEARIQEVNDTPLITVIDRAAPPEEHSRPKRKLNVILAFLLGGLLAAFCAFGREYAERARSTGDEGFQEFMSRLAAIKGEVSSVFHRGRGRWHT